MAEQNPGNKIRELSADWRAMIPITAGLLTLPTACSLPFTGTPTPRPT